MRSGVRLVRSAMAPQRPAGPCGAAGGAARMARGRPCRAGPPAVLCDPSSGLAAAAVDRCTGGPLHRMPARGPRTQRTRHWGKNVSRHGVPQAQIRRPGAASFNELRVVGKRVRLFGEGPPGMPVQWAACICVGAGACSHQIDSGVGASVVVPPARINDFPRSSTITMHLHAAPRMVSADAADAADI